MQMLAHMDAGGQLGAMESGKLSPFDSFAKQVRDLVEGKAREKGYNQTSADGPNELFSFVRGNFGLGHSAGEVIYKVVRYSRKKNKEDLLKAAAWLYLIWRFDE